MSHTEDAHPQLIKTSGPWPFVTRRRYLLAGELLDWQSRRHRKGLRYPFIAGRLGLWAPSQLNWWIAWGFAIGASLFILGSVLSLFPRLPAQSANGVYFAGSIFFTAAAYLQLYQAANSGAPPGGGPASSKPVLFGWQPGYIGWLGSFLQFLGTLLFNVNTLMPLIGVDGWLRQDLEIWVPDVAGSVLFLLSGYLAYIETCHAHWGWRPHDLSWWVVSINLLGCIAFMASAVFAFVPQGAPLAVDATLAVQLTLVGAVGFLIGSLLMLPEGTAAQP